MLRMGGDLSSGCWGAQRRRKQPAPIPNQFTPLLAGRCPAGFTSGESVEGCGRPQKAAEVNEPRGRQIINRVLGSWVGRWAALRACRAAGRLYPRLPLKCSRFGNY